MGRRKIEIKKIENKHQRQICFSKRRMGLFRKAADLAWLGCEIAIIAFSDSGNSFTFGHTDVDELARRFVLEPQPALPHHENDPAGNHAERGGQDPPEVAKHDGEDVAMNPNWVGDNFVDDDDHDDDDEEATESDEMMCDDRKEEAAGTSKEVVALASMEEIERDPRFWWNRPMESRELEELEELARALSKLQSMAKERENELLGEEPLSLCSWAKYIHIFMPPREGF